jgi:hypothetical protein
MQAARSAAAAQACCNDADRIRVLFMGRIVRYEVRSRRHIEQKYLAWLAGAHDDLGPINPGHCIAGSQCFAVDLDRSTRDL